MSRNLLILTLLVSATGCSANRPLLGRLVLTPPRVSFRQLPREDACDWTPIAVTYPSETSIPGSCMPSPVRSAELLAFFEDDELLARPSPSEPVPAVTTLPLVPPVNVPAAESLVSGLATAPPTIVPLEQPTHPELLNLPVQSVAPLHIGYAPIVQTASALLASPVQVESPASTDSAWKPATRISLVSPIPTSTVMRGDQQATPLPEVPGVMPVDPLSPPGLMPPDFSELLTEIRSQRQLIEALHRDLKRERSADDASMIQLEAAFENLVILTKTPQQEMPTTLRK